MLDDGTHWALLDRIDEALDILECAPDDARVRQHRFAKIGAWGMVVRDRYDDWLIIWEPSPTRPFDVNVNYLGRSPLG